MANTDRRFDTSMYDDYKTNPEVYREDARGDRFNIESPQRCPKTGLRVVHRGSIVIAVDGACRNNGTQDAEGASAAYVHPSSTLLNCSWLLYGDVQTNQRAELSAAMLALNISSKLKQHDEYYNDPSRGARRRARDEVVEAETLSLVVIRSDSAYLVNAMTDWIDNWKLNGFRNAKGKPVVNADLFKHIDEPINDLNRHGVQVQFWQIPWQRNTKADYLVNCKLDSISAEEATKRIANGTARI